MFNYKTQSIGQTERYKEVRRDIMGVFRQLRKEGYTALANYKCCNSCAWAAIDDEVRQSEKGYVFWHKQADDDFKKTGTLRLNFGHDVEVMSGEVAEHVVKLLKEKGIPVEWDGNINKKIKVKI